MTGRDLINIALRKLGVLASGETPSAQEASDGLVTLNSLLDSLSNENLLIHTKVEETFTLVAGTQQYTMGSGATFNTARPLKIENAAIRDSTTTPAIDYPMRIIDKNEWAVISLKTLQSEYPMFLYPEGTYPSETLNLWYSPQSAHTLVLWSWKPLTQIATLDTAIALPPGYERMLIFNLSIDLAPEFGRPLSGEIVEVARSSKASIKRTNHTPMYLRCDDIPADQRNSFDIQSGDYRGEG